MMRAASPQQRREVVWWKAVRPLLAKVPRCTPGHACPDCRQGAPCPIDVAHEYAARSLLITPDGEISAQRVTHIARRGGDLEDWAYSVPEVAGHVAWLCVQDYQRRRREPARARAVIGQAETLGLHRVEPWLAVQVAELMTGRGELDAALDLLTVVTETRTTDPARQAARSALARLRVHQDTRERAAAAKSVPTGDAPDGRFRPATRVRPNPYRVSDYRPASPNQAGAWAVPGHELPAELIPSD